MALYLRMQLRCLRCVSVAVDIRCRGAWRDVAVCMQRLRPDLCKEVGQEAVGDGVHDLYTASVSDGLSELLLGVYTNQLDRENIFVSSKSEFVPNTGMRVSAQLSPFELWIEWRERAGRYGILYSQDT